MTPDPFRANLAREHAAVKATAGLAGHPTIVGNLSVRIGDLLICAEDRGRMTREAADEGNFGLAMIHRKRCQEYIASARALIASPGGKEAFALYKERTGQ